jgi:hypothetical protein
VHAAADLVRVSVASSKLVSSRSCRRDVILEKAIEPRQ